MYLPDAFPMTDVTPPPSGHPLSFAASVTTRHYRNEEFGISAKAHQPNRGARILMEYRADCLPRRVFHDVDSLREAYNALPGNAKPVIYLHSAKGLQ